MSRRSFTQLAKAEVLPALLPRRFLMMRGPAHSRNVALTFDDGPDDLTGRYLDLLDELRVPATFFVVGKCAAARPDLMLDYLRRGHEVLSHGYTHRAFPALDRRGLRDELVRTDALCPPSRSGLKMVRPPYGAFTLRTLSQCAASGFTTVLWSLDTLDYKLHEGDQVAAYVATQEITPGEILLLHEGQEWTLQALPRLIRKLREDGFALVTISELLGDTSGDPR